VLDHRNSSILRIDLTFAASIFVHGPVALDAEVTSFQREMRHFLEATCKNVSEELLALANLQENPTTTFAFTISSRAIRTR
jgi:hypothetical protein